MTIRAGVLLRSSWLFVGLLMCLTMQKQVRVSVLCLEGFFFVTLANVATSLSEKENRP